MTTKTADRIEELRAMPYEEYLQTPEWRATRKRILERDNYQCQGCRITGVLFNVHHYTYERLGCEEDEDLVTLCEACHEQLHRLIAEPPKVPFLHKCYVGLGTAALGSIGIEGFLHAPLPAEIAVLIGAVLLARKSPTIYAHLKRTLPEEVLAWFGQAPEARQEGEWTFVDRWMGKHRRAVAQPQENPTEETEVKEVEPMPSIPAQFRIGNETLAAIKEVNAKGYVYFGRTTAREVVLPVRDMYHVLDVAKSGRGKSNRFRNGMMQLVTLADTYYINPFAAPVKAVTDDRKIEVWQPIYDRLANKHPVRESTEILELLTKLVHEIEARSNREQQRDFSWSRRPIFVFIDEVPEIFARCPEAVGLLDRIGRGGRQFCIFAWVASQTALVKDLGLSTASQAQFKTLLYGGGDKTSANRVMGSVSFEQEKALKQSAGLTLMIADGLEDTEFVRAPLVTNEAMFSYFGLPPFKMEEWLVPTKRLEHPTNVLPFTLLPREDVQAQKTPETVEEKSKTETGKRVKGPNEDAILDALNALEEDGKALTLHAIASRVGLTRHQYDEIEAVAEWAGYDLDRGKGRPAKEYTR